MHVTSLDPALRFAAEAVLEGIADGVFVIDSSGCLRLLNGAGERLIGTDRAMWIDRPIVELVHSDDVEAVGEALEALRAGRHVGVLSLRVRDAEGAWRTFEAAPINDIAGDSVKGMICVAQNDVPALGLPVAATAPHTPTVDAGTHHREPNIDQLLEVSTSMVLLLDGHGVVTRASAAFLRLIDRTVGEVEGVPLIEVVSAADAAAVSQAVTRLSGVRCREVVEVNLDIVSREMPLPLRFEMVGIFDDPMVNGIAVTAYDLTELHAALATADRLSRYDDLTGHYNRHALLAEVKQRMANSERFSVALVNLDFFRPVNDLYGYEIGDELLREVGRRLDQSVRPYDFIARMGGDEFAVIASGLDSDKALASLTEQIEVSLSATYHLSTGPVRIAASVGASVADASLTPAMLLADADAAMREVKNERRGLSKTSVFTRRTTAAERMQLVDECRQGLARGEFIAHLQPIIDLRTRKMVRVEALVRWQHPRLGLLRPQAFMNVIEALGYDAELGNAVLESACASLGTLARNGVMPRLSVNFAMGQLSDPTLGRRVASTMRASGIDMSRLVVEITEKALVGRRAPSGTVSPEDALIELHHRGAKLSLDDYGTGATSLSNLRRFPLAEIKIDRSFVSQMCMSAQDRATVEVIIGLARSLGLVAVAEGVETNEQLELLTKMGCDEAQGYFVGVPMSVDDLIQWTWM